MSFKIVITRDTNLDPMEDSLHFVLWSNSEPGNRLVLDHLTQDSKVGESIRKIFQNHGGKGILIYGDLSAEWEKNFSETLKNRAECKRCFERPEPTEACLYCKSALTRKGLKIVLFREQSAIDKKIEETREVVEQIEEAMQTFGENPNLKLAREALEYADEAKSLILARYAITLAQAAARLLQRLPQREEQIALQAVQIAVLEEIQRLERAKETVPPRLFDPMPPPTYVFDFIEGDDG